MFSTQGYYDKVSCALDAQKEVNNQQGVTCLAMCRQVFQTLNCLILQFIDSCILRLRST